MQHLHEQVMRKVGFTTGRHVENSLDESIALCFIVVQVSHVVLADTEQQLAQNHSGGINVDGQIVSNEGEGQLPPLGIFDLQHLGGHMSVRADHAAMQLDGVEICAHVEVDDDGTALLGVPED
jgi:hypothetical protein